MSSNGTEAEEVKARGGGGRGDMGGERKEVKDRGREFKW
jgi:hypothetical protein